MNKTRLTAALLSFSFFIHLVALGQNATIYSEDLLTDLALLHEKLILHHPNLYEYTSQEEMEAYFNNISLLKDSYKRHEAFCVIAHTTSVVKDGHFLIMPDEQSLSQYYSSASLIPIDIRWENDEALITRVYHQKYKDLAGKQLISINGMPLDSIRNIYVTRVLRDGFNQTYPAWISNSFFRPYFHFFFGPFEEFDLEYYNLKEKRNSVVLMKGLRYEELSKKRKELYPKYEQVLNSQKGIEITFQGDVAILTLRSFENLKLRSEYNQKFKNSIRDVFKQIEARNCEKLILDIRGNQGGEVSNGIFLLRYLLNEPFKTVFKYERVDKKSVNNTVKRCRRTSGNGTKHKKPRNNNFKGDLILLIDGGSFSCSGIVANAIQKYGQALIMGEETGGSAYSLVGEPSKKFNLPNSKISVSIPTRRFILQENTPDNKCGVMPEISCKNSASDHIKLHDSVLVRALDELNK